MLRNADKRRHTMVYQCAIKLPNYPSCLVKQNKMLVLYLIQISLRVEIKSKTEYNHPIQKGSVSGQLSSGIAEEVLVGGVLELLVGDSGSGLA